MLARRALTREREWRSAESGDHGGGTIGPSHAAALVDEIANGLDGWPGVRIERRSDGAALVRYGQMELVEHGDAEPADSTPDSHVVSRGVGGRADVTAVLELFDRRCRDLRGEDDAYSSQDRA